MSDTTLPPPSLINMGASCYLNSAFQGISACDIFVKDISDLCNEYKDGKVNQLRVFKELIDIMNGRSECRMDISTNAIFRHWNKYGEQDSYELLVYVMNEVYRELRNHKERNGEIPRGHLKMWLEEKLPMRYTFKWKTVCGCKKKTHSPLLSDLALHVTIPNDDNTHNLNNLIDLYFEEEAFADYKCDTHDCDGKNAKKLIRLCKPIPKTICIHLLRSFWTGEKSIKISRCITFTNELTIRTKYSSDIASVRMINEDDIKCNELRTEVKEDDGATETDNDSGQSLVKENEVETKESHVDNNSSAGDDANGSNESNEQPQNDSPNNNNSMNNDATNDLSSLTSGSGNQVVKENRTSVHLESEICVTKSEEKEHAPMIEITPNKSGEVVKENGSSEHSESENCDTKSEPEKDAPMIEIYPFLNAYEDVETDRIYSLVSVIVHSGTVDGGHYVCYKRVCDKWFLTNDATVSPVPESDVLNSQAYILFYEFK